METTWLEYRFHGCLLFYIDQTNPMHLKVLLKAQGKKQWVEVWTSKTASYT
jgi:hypothetical protein